MGTVLDNLSAKFCDTVAVGTKMAGASIALSQMATALTTQPASKHNLDNGVNDFPAVQQWTVRTP